MQGFSDRFYSGIISAARRPFWIGEDRTWLYADLREAIDCHCGLFDDRGLKPGDRVAIVTADDWLAATLFCAAMLDGLVPFVVSPDAGQARIGGILRLAEPGLIVTDPSRCDENWAQGAGVSVPDDPAQADFDEDMGQFPLDRATGPASHRSPRCDSRAGDTAFVLFTSGTMANPRGVRLSHGNLAAQLADIARVVQLDHGSRLFNALTLAHTDGLIQGPVLCAFAGAVLVRAARFRVSRLEQNLTLIKQQNVSHFLSVPTVYAMIDRFAGRDDYFDASGFRMMISTAAPLHPDLWERLETRFAKPVVNEYGMTETVAATHFAGDFPEMGDRFTNGRPVGCVAEIRDETGAPVPDGQQGVLWIKGPQVFQGYFKDPDRSGRVLVDGWFNTQDLAIRSATGSFTICGRQTTAINSGGFLVLPEEIDEALLGCPKVHESQTIGVPDPDFGAIVVSLVVADADVTDTDLATHCRNRLEHWKVPKHFVRVPEIPRGQNGKPMLGAASDIVNARLCAPPQDVSGTVLDVAARVFLADRAGLEPGMTPEDIPGWDSFAHTVFALEIEKQFGIRLRAREVLGIDRLSDAIALVTARQECAGSPPFSATGPRSG